MTNHDSGWARPGPPPEHVPPREPWLPASQWNEWRAPAERTQAATAPVDRDMVRAIAREFSGWDSERLRLGPVMTYRLPQPFDERFQHYEQELRLADRLLGNITVTAVRLNKPVPGLGVAPRQRVQRLRRALLRPDPRLGPEEFQRRFLVDTDRPDFAAKVLTRALRKFLMDGGTGVYPFRLLDHWLYCALPGHFDGPESRRRAEFLSRVGERLPAGLLSKSSDAPRHVERVGIPASTKPLAAPPPEQTPWTPPDADTCRPTGSSYTVPPGVHSTGPSPASQAGGFVGVLNDPESTRITFGTATPREPHGGTDPRIHHYEQTLNEQTLNGFRSPGWRIQVAAMRLTNDGPILRVEPREHRAKRLLPWPRPDSLPGSEEFREWFKVDTADRDHAAAVLTPKLCRFLLRHKASAPRLRFIGGWMGCVIPGRFDPETARWAEGFLGEVARRLPAGMVAPPPP